VKTCTKCGVEKSLDAFYPSRTGALGRESRCRECRTAQAREKYAANPDGKRKRNREYNRANPHVVSAASARWKERYPEKWAAILEKTRDARYARAVQWAKDNPERNVAKTRRYQSAKLKRMPTWAAGLDYESIYAEARRLTEMTGVRHEVDHIVPLRGKTVSGLHLPWNLQVLPAADNRSKGARF